MEECNPEEKSRVGAWLKADAGNRKEFEKLRVLWEESRKISRESELDADKAWERFRFLREQKDRGALPAKVVPMRSFSTKWVSAAAAVVVLFAVGLLLKWMVNTHEPEPVQVVMVKIESATGILQDTLPDGSVITLNKGSILTYPEIFSDSVRQVTMEGEVFFDVAKNPAKPFIITTAEANIKVLGTSFNVKSRKGNTQVIVETGLVEVAHLGKKVDLLPGKQVSVNAGDTVLKTENTPNTLYRYYRSREFICDNTRLSDLAFILSEAYGITITIQNPEVANMRINTTFSDESLENILNIIEQTMGVKAIKNGDTILIQ